MQGKLQALIADKILRAWSRRWFDAINRVYPLRAVILLGQS